MVEVFTKIIPIDSNEHKNLIFIQNHLLKQNADFLPWLKKQKKKSTIHVTWHKLPYTLYDLCTTKSNQILYNRAWKDIKSQIIELANHNIVHGDVHLKNIMVDQHKKKFYLIDYGLSSNANALSSYEKLCLLYHQDLFQFLWNIVFLSNKEIYSFEPFGNLLREKKLCHEKLLKTVCCFFPSNMKNKIHTYFHCFLKKDLKNLKSKKEKIVFKFFLERLYLSFYIIFVKKDIIFEKFLKEFRCFYKIKIN
jgi:serine/threonine protein kinase